MNKSIFKRLASQEIARIKNLPDQIEDGVTLDRSGNQYNGGGLVLPLVSINTTTDELSVDSLFSFFEQNEEFINLSPKVKVGLYKFPDSNQVSIDMNLIVNPLRAKKALGIAFALGQKNLFSLDSFSYLETGNDGQNPVVPSKDQIVEIVNELTKW